MLKSVRPANEFVTVLGFAGGYVEGAKKLKSLFVIWNEYCPNFLKYDWDLRFFGPYDLKYSFDLEQVVGERFIDCFFVNPFTTSEPVHRKFRLTREGLSLFRRHFNTIREIFEEDYEVRDLGRLVTKLMSYSIIHPAFSVNKAIEIGLKKPLTKNNYTSIEEPSRGFVPTPYVITKEDISKLESYYAENFRNEKRTYLNLEPLTPSQENIAAYKVEIENLFADLRYNYLKPEDKVIKQAKLSVEKFLRRKIELPSLEFLEKRGLISLEDVGNESLKIIEETEASKEKCIEYTLYRLRRFLYATRTEEGLRLEFSPDAVEFVIYPDLKKQIEDWNFGYMVHTMHILQPYEYLAILRE